MKKIKKILLLGSGALKVGQAGEFDYSGNQAIKAMREEGIKVVLINPNIATVQTSKGFADKVYFLPINSYFVEKIIRKEKPQGILLSFGGQTALNCGLDLQKKGILKKHKVQVLGTPVKTIRNTEDRQLFNRCMAEINVKVPKSIAVKTKAKALAAAKKINYPVIVRAAFALGGRGSGIARNETQLKKIVENAFSYSPQVLVEEYLSGWKEIEYEVVRDKYDNCITVCNMENFDPMGIHTGESIVIAPSQTLTNSEYHKLRKISIDVIRHLGIVGECNVQYALDSKSEDYRVIEVNARLSRSSALASKATGYPLAFIAAKLALGKSLTEIQNSITKKTMACFEPALDYCVVKIPRWDLQKFKRVSEEIGSEMKSVGEVMAIGRKFEEALQKAIRMLNIGMYGVVGNKVFFQRLSKILQNPTDKRIFAVVEALKKKNYSVDKINKLTNIDKWFIYKIKNIVDIERKIKKCKKGKIPKELLLKAKQFGFSDKQIAMITGVEDELKIRKLRKASGILPVVKQIDTLAAEFPAKTNYLYLTYNGTKDDLQFNLKNNVLVIGSGPYSIGSSVEFDWCGVSAVRTLNKLNYTTLMINSNPETVSTDYDNCDRLYFDELSLERVLDITDKEKPKGVVVSTGGQIPNSLAMKLHNQKVKILGTSPEDIDRAEDRHKFSALCDSLSIDQPEWTEATTEKAALAFAKKAGYPVLVRPSYVLSGAAMSVAYNESELRNYLKKATSLSKEYPTVISKFITGAKEIEIDAVADKGKIICWAISEHIENAGVHSGDANMVLPPQKTYLETVRRIKETATQLANSLAITGPFNMQFIAKENEIKVIECNLRASRSFPFVSKVTNLNFIEVATKAMLNLKPKVQNFSPLDMPYVAVKSPQFSFSRLKGSDPVCGVEMASTGEVACFGYDLEDAFLKSQLATGAKFPEKNILVSLSGIWNKGKLLPYIKRLHSSGYNIFATKNTAKFLNEHNVKSTMLYKLHENKKPNIRDYVNERKIDLVVCIPDPYIQIELDDEYELRRATIDHNIPLITNRQLARLFLSAILNKKMKDLDARSWQEWLKEN